MKKEKRILNHFKKTDPVLFSIADDLEIIEPRKTNEYFPCLCREIIAQQLHGKVASVIFERFRELFPNKRITPKNVLKFSGEKLRNVGMAWSKVKSIKDLSERVSSGSLDLKTLKRLSDGEVMKELTKVKGIGPWTTEMFLMFTLGREDVFSEKDLGLRKAIIKHYGKELPQEHIEKWSPYKTYASLILWKSVD